MKASVLTLAFALLAALALAACGSGRHERSPATVATSQTTSRSDPSPRTQPRMFADYDDDDYLHGYADQDADDHHQPKDRDGDIDARASTGYYDEDDSGVRDFGRPATAAERAPIVALVARYYSAAAHDDGARICAMIDLPLARAYVRTVGNGGAHFARGLSSCQQIVSKIFAGATRMLAFSLRLGITGVRVSHHVALVVLGVRPFPIRVFEAIREAGRWRVYGSLDTEMP